MNPQGTSFIPQRPTQGTVKKRGVRKIYILTYISYVLFFGSALAAAGTFFYGLVLDSRLQEQKDNLVAERDKFSEEDIDIVRDLDKKIDMAASRMDLHLSVLGVFDALERTSVQSMILNSFKYKRENDTAPVLELSGKATIFNTLMYQRDVLESNPILSGGEFSEVALNASASSDEEQQDGRTVITFDLKKEVDPSLIMYVPRTDMSTEMTELSEDQVDLLDGQTDDEVLDTTESEDVTDVQN